LGDAAGFGKIMPERIHALLAPLLGSRFGDFQIEALAEIPRVVTPFIWFAFAENALGRVVLRDAAFDKIDKANFK
jgi:hypothetical protein